LQENELAELLDLARRWDGEDARDAHAEEAIRLELVTVRADGFATAAGTTEAKFSAIALPVRQSGAVIGAINIIFFRRAMTTSEAAERYLDRLKSVVCDIEDDLSGSLHPERVPGR